MQPYSRRAFLSAVAGAGLALAGCSTPSGSSSTPTESPAPITGVDVTEQSVVVGVAEDTAVSELSLIGPDGEAVTSRSVAAGETQVTLPILEIDPDIAGYEHYTPGEHELVAVVDGEAFSQTLSLQPAIEIVAVEQYQEGSSPADLGRLSVHVANRGTGPTWVHDITFENSPNPDANDALIEEPGVPQVTLTTGERDTTLSPNEEIRLLTSESPLLFHESNEEGCGSDLSSSMLIGTPVGQIQTDIRISAGGEKRSLPMVNSYVCNSVEAQISTNSITRTSERLEPISREVLK
jgi:hypothetical protein